MRLPVPSSWIAPLTQYELHLRAAGCSEATIARRVGDLEQIAREVGPDGPATITGDALVSWAGEKAWATETRRSRRASARLFWKWGIATGVVTEDAAAKLPHISAARPKPRPVPDRIYRPAVAAAVPRVALMLRLAGELGLRRAEIARIHVGRDLVEDDEGYSLIVHGKGGKVAPVPVPDDLGRRIAQGAQGHSPLDPDATRTGWLFPGRIDGHLSPRRVGELCGEALQAYQDEGEEPFTVHKCRHRFGTRALRATRDILAVRDALRHTSVATTQVYCAVERDAVRAAVNAAA
ncbi:site-specific integrase [Nocardia puris]|uniref:tyrosine-type recombinase/integrase n=1 Tax=Nocardia puris TaxID=208602 RepID=UPI0018959802|nr:site-specific integrase [Nocardia puris]MBF6213801.1 site-specific integrase [Nocardia puris]